MPSDLKRECPHIVFNPWSTWAWGDVAAPGSTQFWPRHMTNREMTCKRNQSLNITHLAVERCELEYFGIVDSSLIDPERGIPIGPLRKS